LIVNGADKHEVGINELLPSQSVFCRLMCPFLTLQPDDEIKGAEEKFAESLQHAQMGMYHLLENDVRCLNLHKTDLFHLLLFSQVEQVSQLAYFAEALLDYHSQCTEILRGLVENMQEKYEIRLINIPFA